jgi:hypothetical protein
MISLHMQGGCLCENQPTLRLDTNNVEIAATIAPRPLLMISATGDWTKETMEVEYPAMRSIYELMGAVDRVHAVRIDAEHNYNRASREAMYAWMARWLKNAPADVRVEERSFSVEPLQDLLVFHQRPRPETAVNREQLTDAWIAAAKRQAASTPPSVSASVLRHVLGFADGSRPPSTTAARRVVLIASSDPAIDDALTKKGWRVVPIQFTPFDANAAKRVRHFETYNRSAASQRAADIVAALRANPGAAIVADGDASLAALLAFVAEPASAAVLDVGAFDTSSDQSFIDRLFVPGLRRAGDLQTAAAFRPKTTIVHNAGDRFAVNGIDARAAKLTPTEIAAALAGVNR